MKYTLDESIVAIATALYPSALAVVRASGKNSIELTSKIFSRPKALLNATGNSLVHGWILKDDVKIDEVLVAVYRAPKSFTGEEMTEIFCHGGIPVVKSIFNLMLKSGFRTAKKGEFTFRAFVNSKTDLTRAEAVNEIIESKTDISRKKAAMRLSGELFLRIQQVKKILLNSLGELEAEIEYPEDENAIAKSFNVENLKNANEILQTLSDSWQCERLYQDGAKAILCGKTNAGKSSLFNVLLKEERAIVSSTPGTTRDWLESWADFAGIPVRLFDTAGIRETANQIEGLGVERAKNLCEQADLILYIVDSLVDFCEDDKKFLAEFSQKKKIIVLNKIDESRNAEIPKVLLEFPNIVKVSAKTGAGIPSLVSLAKSILENSVEKNDDVALGSERQKLAIDDALKIVCHAIFVAQSNEFGLDAVVQDLEDALSALAEVTGETTPQDVLDNIFSRFCVGK